MDLGIAVVAVGLAMVVILQARRIEIQGKVMRDLLVWERRRLERELARSRGEVEHLGMPKWRLEAFDKKYPGIAAAEREALLYDAT